MEVLLIAYYIIGSLSAFILITFRIAGSSCIYKFFFFFQKRLISISKPLFLGSRALFIIPITQYTELYQCLE